LYGKIVVALVIIFLVAYFAVAAFGQTNDTETRTFNNCYQSYSTTLFLRNMIQPDSKVINLMDPEVRQLITDTCNFFHEKTGIWTNAQDKSSPELRQEFYDKYISKLSPDLQEENKTMNR
jgi:hypothetical protein